ncbi:MAG: AraC family transcriptional regulator [Actinomycetota bacterium]|nr:AraC family transcriptional regulator [Actinomycetota bacterium]
MDALAGLLDGPRARGAYLMRSLMNPPWSLRILAEAPITLLAIVKGEAWIVPDDGERVRLGPGDVAATRGPDHYIVADNPSTTPDVVIHPGQRCTTVDGEDLFDAMDLGVRTWGNDSDGSTIMLVGAYESMGDIGERLLRALPPVMSLGRDQWDSPLIPLLADEVVKDDPGQSAVLDRLLDLLLIAFLREWLGRPEAEAPAWYQAQGDPIVGRALRSIYTKPAYPWTVASLAAESGASRAALARRFHDLVGEPPMTFLTGWRVALAADLLRDPDATVGSVATEVGYRSPFAFSTAFKRVRGISPTEHRAHTLSLA